MRNAKALKTNKIDRAVAKAKEGDGKYCSVLMDVFWDDIFRYISIKTQNKNDAEDIAINTFSKAFEKIHLYNDKYDFKKWLIAIAHNTIIDFYRKHKKYDFFEWEVANISIPERELPEEIFIINQNKKVLKNVISTLKPNYSKIINLRFIEEKSYKEISDELNISISNTKVTLMRAKKILYKKMKDGF